MNASYRLNTCKSRGSMIEACFDRWPGGPLPRLQPNQTHPHPSPQKNFAGAAHARTPEHRVLIFLSEGCPRVTGRLDTRYSPIRRSPPETASSLRAAPRLACVKPVASVHPEPGSNSSLYNCLYLQIKARRIMHGA